MGGLSGAVIGVLKGVIRSLDYSSCIDKYKSHNLSKGRLSFLKAPTFPNHETLEPSSCGEETPKPKALDPKPQSVNPKTLHDPVYIYIYILTLIPKH